jgi:hypothetical protein
VKHISKTKHRQAQNSIPDGLRLLDHAKPKFLQLKITIDLRCRSWQCYAGAAGAGRYLNFYAGRLPDAVARKGEQQANLYALNEATRQVAQRFTGARVMNIEFQAENVGAAIARLELGSVRWAA